MKLQWLLLTAVPLAAGASLAFATDTRAEVYVEIDTARHAETLTRLEVLEEEHRARLQQVLTTRQRPGSRVRLRAAQGFGGRTEAVGTLEFGDAELRVEWGARDRDDHSPDVRVRLQRERRADDPSAKPFVESAPGILRLLDSSSDGRSWLEEYEIELTYQDLLEARGAAFTILLYADTGELTPVARVRFPRREVEDLVRAFRPVRFRLAEAEARRLGFEGELERVPALGAAGAGRPKR